MHFEKDLGHPDLDEVGTNDGRPLRQRDSGLSQAALSVDLHMLDTVKLTPIGRETIEETISSLFGFRFVSKSGRDSKRGWPNSPNPASLLHTRSEAFFGKDTSLDAGNANLESSDMANAYPKSSNGHVNTAAIPNVSNSKALNRIGIQVYMPLDVLDSHSSIETVIFHIQNTLTLLHYYFFHQIHQSPKRYQNVPQR